MSNPEWDEFFGQFNTEETWMSAAKDPEAGIVVVGHDNPSDGSFSQNCKFCKKEIHIPGDCRTELMLMPEKRTMVICLSCAHRLKEWADKRGMGHSVNRRTVDPQEN